MNIPDALKHLGEAWSDLNAAVAAMEAVEADAAKLEKAPEFADAIKNLKAAAGDMGQTVANVRDALKDL